MMIAVLLVACTGVDAPPATYGDALSVYASSYCERSVACDGGRVELCEATLADTLLVTCETDDRGIKRCGSIDESLVFPNWEAFTACVAELEATACDAQAPACWPL